MQKLILLKSAQITALPFTFVQIYVSGVHGSRTMAYVRFECFWMSFVGSELRWTDVDLTQSSVIKLRIGSVLLCRCGSPKCYNTFNRLINKDRNVYLYNYDFQKKQRGWIFDSYSTAAVNTEEMFSEKILHLAVVKDNTKIKTYKWF